jgi:acyl transferase domain-containing protein/acyl carrier protein
MNRSPTQATDSSSDTEAKLKQALRQAATSIKELIAENEALKQKSSIAMIGIACRFPGGADTPNKFWDLLTEGIDAIVQAPSSRWEAYDFLDKDLKAPGKMYTAQGGFLKEDIEQFDAQFFGISPNEARAMDPQHRLLLEVSWEALENAFQVPEQLKFSRTGVYVGISGDDYALNHRHSARPETIDAYSITGSTFSTAAGRISYLFGLQGPCMALDTACSSSLVAIHQAVKSLQNRESNLALAGAVNLILHPYMHIGFSKLQAISPDGRCKTFDASANGYVRGEGCAMIVLKRLEDAERDGDRILGIIKGTAINQDGKTNGLAAPNGKAQQAVIREALADANLSPNAVDYVETHGTGTILGDPIEVEALSALYGSNRETDLLLGSVKTNIGHLEPVAGMAGLSKILLSLEHERIPKNLHFSSPNPHIPWNSIPLHVVNEPVAWKKNDAARVAGLSSFGFSGTNAHLIISEYPAEKKIETPRTEQYQILNLSAQDPNGLADLAARYLQILDNGDLSLNDLCYSASLGRTHWSYRLSVICKEREDLVEGLKSYLGGTVNPNVLFGQVTAQQPKIAFLFTGQGSQYATMGAHLYATELVFKTAFDRCDEIFQSLTQQSIKSIIFEQGSDSIHETGITQPALFSLAYSLCQLWSAWGIKPQTVMGHSVGEYAAACSAGIFSLEDGVRLISKRAALMQSLPTGGAMAALFCSRETITPFLANYQQQVEIAAVNSPKQILVSGDKDAIVRLCNELTAAKIDSHILNVSHAFHSYLMDDILSEFKLEAERIQYNKPEHSIVSNLSGTEANETLFSSQYWVEHIRRPVEFSTGMQTIEDKAIDAYIEIGPEPILLGLAKQNTTRTPVWLASLRKSVPDQVQMYRALAGLYVLGADIKWKNVFANKQAKWSTIPNYPFQRKKHWQAITHRQAEQQTQSDGGAGPFGLRYTESPLLAWDIVSGSLSSQALSLLNQHQVLGKTIFAAASYISLLFESAQLFSRTVSQSVAALTVRDVLFELPLVIPEVTAINIQLAVENLDASIRKFKLISLDALDAAAYSTHASGSIELNPNSPQSKSAFSPLSFENTWASLPTAISKKQIYQQLEKSKIKLGDSHQWLNEIRLSESMALATLSMPTSIDSHTGRHDGFILHPGLLDSCFCLFASLINSDGAKTLVPFAVESFHINQHVTGTQFFAIAMLRDRLNTSGKTIGDIDLFDGDGHLVGQCLGIEGREISLESLEKLLHDTSHSLCFGQGWESHELVSLGSDSSTSIVFFTADQEFDQVLCQQLRAAGHRVTVIKKSPAFKSLDSDTFSLNPQVKEQFIQLAEALSHPDNAFTSVIYGWGLGTDGSLEEMNRGSIEPLLYALQTLIDKASEHTPLQLFILTANAQFISAASRDAPVNLHHSILLGFGKNIPLEYPQVKCAVIDLDSTASDSENSHFVCQHVEQSAKQACRLTIPATGSLGDLAWQACERAEPQVGEVEIEVHATGLNFKDVLLALHRVPAMGDGLGVECAGRVVKLGPGVTEFALGERVLAMVPGSLSRFVCAPVATTVSLPAAMDDRAAATIPITFLTAAYALESLAHLRPGERVLIHAATGGVGQAAIQIAQAAGAVVFATASQGKWQILKDLGVEHIFDSRTTEFEAAIQALTHGEGLDVVLNSLRGEFTDASLRLLRAGGRFLEIGITDLRTPAQIAQFSSAIEYFPIDLMVLYREQRQVLQALLRKLLERFATNELKPLPYQTFAAEAVETAFRTMQQAKHTGKVIIDMQQQALVTEQHDNQIALRNNKRWVHRLQPWAHSPVEAFQLDADGHYLIVGGLGGLGYLLTKNLIDRGARYLSLCGRSLPANELAEKLNQLKHSGVHIDVSQVDVLDSVATAQWLEQANQKRNVKGILFLAGQLHDGLIQNMSWLHFEKVLNVKTQGLLNIDTLSRTLSLDFFIAFSSLTSLTGSPGQTSYVAANTFVDHLMQHRASLGLPGLSINWGPWEEAGMAQRLSASQAKRLLDLGILPLATGQALKVLNGLGQQTPPQLGVAAINWSHFLKNFPNAANDLFYSTFRQTQTTVERTSLQVQTQTQHIVWRDLLNEVDSSSRERRLVELLKAAINKVIGANENDQIELRKPLFDLGLDSLTAVELKNRLETNLLCSLSTTLLFDYPTLEALSAHLKTKMSDLFAADAPQLVAPAVAVNTPTTDEFDDLSQDDLEMLLASKLKK